MYFVAPVHADVRSELDLGMAQEAPGIRHETTSRGTINPAEDLTPKGGAVRRSAGRGHGINTGAFFRAAQSVLNHIQQGQARQHQLRDRFRNHMYLRTDQDFEHAAEIEDDPEAERATIDSSRRRRSTALDGLEAMDQDGNVRPSTPPGPRHGEQQVEKPKEKPSTDRTLDNAGGMRPVYLGPGISYYDGRVHYDNLAGGDGSTTRPPDTPPLAPPTASVAQSQADASSADQLLQNAPGMTPVEPASIPGPPARPPLDQIPATMESYEPYTGMAAREPHSPGPNPNHYIGPDKYGPPKSQSTLDSPPLPLHGLPSDKLIQDHGPGIVIKIVYPPASPAFTVAKALYGAAEESKRSGSALDGSIKYEESLGVSSLSSAITKRVTSNPVAQQVVGVITKEMLKAGKDKLKKQMKESTAGSVSPQGGGRETVGTNF